MATTYVPQLTAYSPDNLYTSGYYAGNYAGYPALPNCTRYCFGRWWSLMGNPPTGLYYLGNGEDWWNNCTAYSKGQTPKLGAIACFRDGPYSGWGHVAIVEQIYSDGAVLFSNSAYKGSMFYLKCGYPANDYHGPLCHGYYTYEPEYIFQGFIYFPEDFDPDPDPPPDPPPDPSDPGYRAKPLLRYYAKKQIYRNQGRLIGNDVYN